MSQVHFTAAGYIFDICINCSTYMTLFAKCFTFHSSISIHYEQALLRILNAVHPNQLINNPSSNTIPLMLIYFFCIGDIKEFKVKEIENKEM